MKFLSCILPDFVLENQFSNTPEGIFRIHSLLKMSGHESRLMDFRNCRNEFEMESVLMVFAKSDFDVCLISATTAQGNIVNSFAKSFKKKFASKMLVLGGTHVNAILSSDKWTQPLFELHPNVDCFACGYYWDSVDIGFFISHMGRGKIVYGFANPSKDTIIPMPYEDLQNNCVSMTGGVIRNGSVGEIKTQNMLISSGCIYKCAFCFNELDRCRRPEPSDVVKELRRRVGKYGIQGIKINDDDAFQNVAWNEKLIPFMKDSGLDLKFLASTRASIKHGGKKLASLVELNKVGLKVLGLGLEWASDDVLKMVNKCITVQSVKDSIIALNENTDCEILLYSIYGLPGMNEKAVDNMIEFLQWAKGKVKHVSITNFVPLIGTDIYENPEKYGMELMVPTGYINGHIEWEEFYFNGGFDNIRALQHGNTRERFLDDKARVYRCLHECGFLRRETENDMKKAGYSL